MHPFLTIADRAARLAGRRIIQTLSKQNHLKIYEKKNTYEQVTDLDITIEKLLIEHIQTAYPSHSILGEETGLLQRDEDYLWIIDPLDGTTNFIHGLSGFAISIAIKKQGELYQGLVYDPLAQETFYASKSKGAQLHQKRLHISSQRHLKRALLYINRPPIDHNLKQWSRVVQLLAEHSVSIRMLGSAALGLAYVAAGRLDGFLSFSQLKPWDIAAGALLVNEAGGDIQNIDGSAQYFETGQLVAANSSLIPQLNELINSTT